MTEYFEVGKILSPHGLTGEVKVNATTDFPEERLANGSRLFIKNSDQYQELIVEATRRHKQFYLVKFEGIDDIDQAEKVRGKELYVAEADQQELPEGSYYFKDILIAQSMMLKLVKNLEFWQILKLLVLTIFGR